METVYAVISELNGYKRLENIYRNRQDAEEFKSAMKSDYRYDMHDIYICEYPLF